MLVFVSQVNVAVLFMCDATLIWHSSLPPSTNLLVSVPVKEFYVSVNMMKHLWLTFLWMCIQIYMPTVWIFLATSAEFDLPNCVWNMESVHPPSMYSTLCYYLLFVFSTVLYTLPHFVWYFMIFLYNINSLLMLSNVCVIHTILMRFLLYDI